MEINKTINYLNNEFSIKDLGELRYFMGIEIIKKIRLGNHSMSGKIHIRNSE